MTHFANLLLGEWLLLGSILYTNIKTAREKHLSTEENTEH